MQDSAPQHPRLGFFRWMQRCLLGEPVSALRLILLVSAAPIAQGVFEAYIFGDGIHNWMVFAIAYVYHVVDGCIVLATIRWLDPLLEYRGVSSVRWRVICGVLAITACTIIAYRLIYLGAFPRLIGRPINPDAYYQWWYHVTAMALIIYVWLVLNRAARKHANDLLYAQLETDQLATNLANAELAVLEAQIEPHFLFNTLAHIKRQYRLDPEGGSRMLLALTAYLDRAMPALQCADWTIGDELELIDIYLCILVQRFGGRLKYEISTQVRSNAHSIPGLTIATLVENAVRHGLTPKLGGGTVQVLVENDLRGLAINVLDDGVGLRTSSGSGLGLATVRARLRSQFGDRASLAIGPGNAGGVRATIYVAEAI